MLCIRQLSISRLLYIQIVFSGYKAVVSLCKKLEDVSASTVVTTFSGGSFQTDSRMCLCTRYLLTVPGPRLGLLLRCGLPMNAFWPELAPDCSTVWPISVLFVPTRVCRSLLATIRDPRSAGCQSLIQSHGVFFPVYVQPMPYVKRSRVAKCDAVDVLF